MGKYLIIGIGGLLGAVLRYIVSGIIPVKFGIPTGTLTVNLIGSFFSWFFNVYIHVYISATRI